MFTNFYVGFHVYNHLIVCFLSVMRKLIFLGLAILLVTWTRADDDEGEKKKDKESVGTVIGIDLGTTYSW